MDPAVVAALISSAVTLIVGITSLFKRDNSPIPTRREIMYRQLTELFEPVEKIFFLHPDGDPDWIFSEIYAVVSHTLPVAPFDFLGLVMNIREKGVVKKEDISLLQRKADTYFNYLRKYFGFPHIKTEIDWTHRILILYKRFELFLPLILGIIALALSLVSFCVALSEPPVQTVNPEFSDSIAAYIAMLCSLFGFVMGILSKYR